ncbi:MAG TPA: DoxX family protein [Acidimicrobiales bacterium]|nr:DoxX family protein [Acidimicrobiales bacterium]
MSPSFLADIAFPDLPTWSELSVGLLILRVVVGLTLASHGWNKFFGGGKIAGTGRWFDSMGMRPGKVHALAAASTELGGGVLFALGLLTPLAAAGMVGVMVVAGWTSHRTKGFFIVKSGWEYNLVLATVAVGVATTSPGQFSLDWALGLTPAFDPVVGLVVSAGLGLAAGIGLILACYRPPAPPEPGTER